MLAQTIIFKFTFHLYLQDYKNTSELFQNSLKTKIFKNQKKKIQKREDINLTVFLSHLASDLFRNEFPYHNELMKPIIH